VEVSHKRQSIAAVKWAFLGSGGSQIILLINTLVLARLLDPKDFGLISMLYIFMSLSSAFVDSGMAGGLVRKQNATQADSSTLFYFNIIVAVLLYLILFLAAPFIASFYQEPKIEVLLRVLSLNIIIGALTLIHKTVLYKELKVGYVTRADLIGSFFAVIAGIISAYMGLGVWSLVILQITQSFISMCIMSYYSKWKPTFVFSFESLKEFYSFGLGLFLSTFLDVIFKNIYQPIIGKFFGVTYAGLYYQARRLYELPISTISSVVDSVSYPLLVKYQHDREQLKSSYLRIFKLLIFVSLPIVMCLSILSEDIVTILLTKKWIFSAQLLSILSFSGIFMILETINRSLLKIEGRTKLIFKLEVIKKLAILLVIMTTYKFGMIYLMYGIVFSSMFSFCLNQYYASIRLTSFRDVLIILFNGLMMGLVMYIVNTVDMNPFISLFISISCGAGMYLFLGFVFKVKEMQTVLSIVKNKLQ
jgi:teichuronic acid exporter